MKIILHAILTLLYQHTLNYLYFIFVIIEHILEDSYHGLIKENETFVEITPLMKVDEEKVCRLEIIKKQKEIPFKVMTLFLMSILIVC